MQFSPRVESSYCYYFFASFLFISSCWQQPYVKGIHEKCNNKIKMRNEMLFIPLFLWFYRYWFSSSNTKLCGLDTRCNTQPSWVNTTWIAEIYGIIRLLDRTIYKLFNFVSISPRTNSLPFNFCARSGKTTSITFYSFILFEIAWQVSINIYGELDAAGPPIQS